MNLSHALLIGISSLLLLMAGCGPGIHARWKSDYVEANGIRLHYWRTGEGSEKPVIVAVHGITDSGLCWTSLAVELDGDYDLILYDARGHGLSDKPDAGYEIADHVADLAGLISALELDKPYLMGHSMGGAIAAVAAAEHPDLALAVILEDPAWLRTPPEAAAQAEDFRQRLEGFQSKSVADFMDLVGDEHPNWPFEDWRPWAEAKTQVSPKVLRTYEALPALEDYFPRIEVPVLILKADAPQEERAWNERSAALLPHGRITHVEGAGHNVRRDELSATKSAIRSFLRGGRLWQAADAYRRAGDYTLEVSANGRDHEAREDFVVHFTLGRSNGEEGRPTTAVRYTGTDAGRPPKELGDREVPTQWLEFGRALDLEITGSGWDSMRSGEERSNYRVLRAHEEGLRFWINDETRLIDRVVIHGSVSWTMTIQETHLGKLPKWMMR